VTNSSAIDGGPRRRRDSAGTRERLLRAAGELFAERGYDRTTIREIGQRADVDPALIARHFGNKAALYLHTLRPNDQSATPLTLHDPLALQGLVERAAKHPTPTMYAAVRRHDDPELQAAAQAMLQTRIVQNAEQSARTAELDRPELRAEIVTAALAGVLLSRSSGALPHLSAAPAADVGQLLADLLGPLISS
jgi:AcrR family transcriptional regulator